MIMTLSLWKLQNRNNKKLNNIQFFIFLLKHYVLLFEAESSGNLLTLQIIFFSANMELLF